MTYQRQSIITRKARVWPEIPKETVTLPAPPSTTNTANPMILITIFFSMLGMVFYAFIFSRINPTMNQLFLVGLLAMSAFMALGSLITFSYQWIPARRRLKRLRLAYIKKVQEVELSLQMLERQDRQGRIELDPPFMLPNGASSTYKDVAIVPIFQRSLTNQDMGLWARRPDDPDFLSVRLGMGNCSPSFKLHSSRSSPIANMPVFFVRMHDRVEALLEQYASLVSPITVSLSEHGPVAITGTAHRLAQGRALAYAMVCQIAYHHSPEDVRIIILAPESQAAAWEWTAYLPHTIAYEPRQSAESNEELGSVHMVAIGAEAILNQLPLISRELGRRELLLGDSQRGNAAPILPRLVIIVDHFDDLDDLDQPTLTLPVIIPDSSRQLSSRHRSRLSVTPLKRAEMTLALNHGKSLGVSVVCVCGDKVDIPTTSGVMIDLDPVSSLPMAMPHSQQGPHGDISSPLPPEAAQACVRMLCPDPPPSIICDQVDMIPFDALRYFAQRLQPLRSLTTKRLEIRLQVDLRTLFEPELDLSTYAPVARWKDALFHSRTGVPLMRVPIGLKIGDETQYLDFVKDGPHGLLIGQTGSGKSELLQTIIAALAVAYKPTEVNFLLIDYKAGLALEPFRTLPHTIGFLSNVSSPALIERFIIMLRAEATRRELRLKEGKATPRLVIIIDEFAEMAKRTEAVLNELFTITRVGREIGMHLLLSAQRPEGIIGSKVRDYVQYRLCLRCASSEDSREVLRRVDAAFLPASIPGRCYLLHGDNQLDLFQAARVTIPAT